MKIKDQNLTVSLHPLALEYKKLIAKNKWTCFANMNYKIRELKSNNSIFKVINSCIRSKISDPGISINKFIEHFEQFGSTDEQDSEIQMSTSSFAGDI